ncbi:tRNA modification GTPase TrmE, partial [Collybia nuda]
MWRSSIHAYLSNLKAHTCPTSLPTFLNRSRLLHRPQNSVDRCRRVHSNKHFSTHVQGARLYADPHVPTLSDSQRHTIYALSTPPGKAGVAVVRVSGPDAFLVWKRMVRIRGGKGEYRSPVPWKMERCRIIQPEESGEALDDGLAVYFRAPRSFTKEDVVELHLHSGRAIVSSVLSALSKLPFCRPAEPGEFTRRAFEAGGLDLTQVEGLKDLIDAETEGQRRIALRAAGGIVKAQFDELRSGIIRCLANVEALIDFGEGEDIEDGVYDHARLQAQLLLVTIREHLDDKRRGEIIRSGIRLAIFGPPNAGKSSLLNFFAQREAAIVTPVPGTTRDILELSLDIGGLPVIVADTAGLRKTNDIVEIIGIERANVAVQTANISLCVLSLPEVLEFASDGPQLRIPKALKQLITPNTHFLFNKSDLLKSPISSQALCSLTGKPAWTASLTTGEGLTKFLEGFSVALQNRLRYDLHEDRPSSQAPLITRARHRIHLESACRFLEAFLRTSPHDVVLGAEELRYAAQAVGKVSGSIDVEDVLDSVFKDFCIGK